MRRIGLVLAFVFAAWLGMHASVAEARSEKALAYPRDQAWPAAVRWIRVDERLKVIEKDADAGYVLFELREDKKTFRGSLEVIDSVKDGRHLVRFVIQLEDRPEWVELQMLDRLEQKLRAELGSPAPAPSAPQKPAAPPQKPRDDPSPAKPTPPAPGGITDDPPPISATP
jgi:hypothetical protein